MAAESNSLERDGGLGSSPSGRSEEELLGAARRGEERAFEELVVMTQDRLYNLALRMTGTHEDAEDALQDAYIRAHRALGSFEGGSQFYTWMYRIAVNSCLTRGRRASKRDEREGLSLDAPAGGADDGLSALSASVPGGDRPPVDGLIADERAAAVHAAVARLPEEYRTVIVLRDVEGLSYDELGRITRSTRAAIKSRLHRARQRLAEMLVDLR